MWGPYGLHESAIKLSSITKLDHCFGVILLIFKLIVHPVNDPPIVTTFKDADTELYMNNEFYPNGLCYLFNSIFYQSMTFSHKCVNNSISHET